MCTPDVRDWILPVGFCGVLSIALVFFLAFHLTFSAVCVVLTLLLFVYYYYNYYYSDDWDEWIDPRSSDDGADAPTNGSSGDDRASDGRADGSERPESSVGLSASLRDRHRFSSANSTVHALRGLAPFVPGGLTQRLPGAIADGITRRLFQCDRTDDINWSKNCNSSSYTHQVPPDSSSIPSSSVVDGRLENGAFSENKSVINSTGEHSPLGPPEGHYSRLSSSSSSPPSTLPKFRRVQHDVSVQENVPLSGSESGIVSHPTHQALYGSLGILPSVRSLGAHQSAFQGRDGPSFNYISPFAKVAPPDPLKESLVLQRQEEDVSVVASSSNSNDVLVTSGKAAFAEKRKRTVEGDVGGEAASSPLETLNKRRKTNAEMLSPELSSEPMQYTSYYPNLKRPALRSQSDESVSSKVQRLTQPVSPPLYVQPGASARNPVEASYTSSRRWIERLVTPEVSGSSKTSPSVAAGQSLQSEVRISSKTWDIIDEISPKSGRTDIKGRSSVDQFSKSPVRTARSSGRNTPVSASVSPKQVSQGTADRKRVNKTGSLEDSLRTDQTPSSSVNSSSELVNYKVHVTAEDVEKDREKEMERIRHILGEDSHLASESENQQQPASSSFISLPSASIQSDVVDSAADAAPVVTNLSPTTTAASSPVSVTHTVNMPLLCHNAVTVTSESSGSKLISITGADQSQPVTSLQLSVATGASLNSTQFTVSSPQPDTPLRSAGFDVGPSPAASPGGFPFGLPALNKSPTTVEMTVTPSTGGFHFQPSATATVATGAMLKPDLANGKDSGVHSATTPGINANNSSNSFLLDVTKKVSDTFVSQSSSVSTSGICFGNAGSSAMLAPNFTFQNSFSQNKSTVTNVFPNALFSGSNAGPTTSDVIPSSNQTLLPMPAIDVLNDITKSQMLKDQNAPKTTSYCFTRALGFSGSSNNPLFSSSNVSMITTTSVNSMPVNSFINPQTSVNPFGSSAPVVTSNSSQATNLFSTNLFSSPTCSAGIFGQTSTANTFDNRSVGSSTPFAGSPQTGFNFGNQADQHNAFGSQATSGFPIHSNFASSSAMDSSKTSEQTMQAGSFGSFFNVPVDPKSVGSQIFTGGQNSSLSSGQISAFPQNQNPGNANAGMNMFAPAVSSQSPFSFGSPANLFNFGQNSGFAFPSVPSNSAAVSSNQFPPSQSQFNFSMNPSSPFTPRFSIGADSSGTAKSRPSLKNRLKKR